MYRLLALDMDGTLLNQSKIITPRVRQSLQALIRKGVKVTIASGRFPASVWLHGNDLGMNCPLIAFNGAVILDEKTGEKIHGYPIQPYSARRIAELSAQIGTYVHFYGYGELYVEALNEWNVNWPLANVVIDADKPVTYENYQSQADRIQVKPVGCLASFAKAATEPLYKATVISNDTGLLNKMYTELESEREFSLTRTGHKRFDINAAGISKKSALELVCGSYGITASEVVAIGDYDNDVNMLQWAELGIAMANGSHKVKKASKAVTSSNNEDGVAEAVLKYFQP